MEQGDAVVRRKQEASRRGFSAPKPNLQTPDTGTAVRADAWDAPLASQDDPPAQWRPSWAPSRAVCLFGIAVVGLQPSFDRSDKAVDRFRPRGGERYSFRKREGSGASDSASSGSVEPDRAASWGVLDVSSTRQFPRITTRNSP